jgi:hypothetical protein
MRRKPEISLLLDGTSVRPSLEAISRLRQAILPSLDWSEVLRNAISHGVLPLLSRNLSLYAAADVPPITLAQLRLFSKKVSVRNREQSLELVKLITAFSREGIRVLPFKGPVCCLQDYVGSSVHLVILPSAEV